MEARPMNVINILSVIWKRFR